MEISSALLGVEGLGLDIAGAVVLAWSFSAKKPDQIRAEVPQRIQVSTTIGGGSFRFPQGLAASLIRQRAEARLGLVLLVAGFGLQTVNAILGLGALESADQRWTAVVVILLTWAATYCLGMRVYVPWEERRVAAAVPD